MTLHLAEVKAYSVLEELQGEAVPMFIANVGITPHSTDFDNVYLQTPGILIEYIHDAFPLKHFPFKTDEVIWGDICEETIRKLNRISDLGLLNEDIRSENLLIQPADTAFREIFVHFARSYTRDLYYSDTDWIESKRRQHEEARLGGFMANMMAYSKSTGKGKNRKRYKGNAPLPFMSVLIAIECLVIL
jgi:hypothetical protein